MVKMNFRGTAKLTPAEAKCDPIMITGDWSYNAEIDRWMCKNAKPKCYSDIWINDAVLERVENQKHRDKK